ncbi:MAG: J domain-containing protein [Pyrinomonadaceae bacterium]
MIDYYKILSINANASRAEIKSAYRKLARQRHPDLNRGSEGAAREFALLSKAYHTLSDAQERAYYDEQLFAQKNRSYSILESDNPHAKRARNLAVQAKWDRLVDEVLERDRKENNERQRAVFTTVSLFLSTFFVAMIRPQLWDFFDYFGRTIVLTLFVIGVWHLFTRLREYLQHYTYIPKPIQESIIREDKTPEQPFTRFSAYTFLLVGYALSVGIGLYIGWHTQDFFNDITMLFRPRGVVHSTMLAYTSTALLVPDLVVYPPIAVLIVDTMHGLASRID